MDLQKFDSTLKSALENLEVPFDPSTWAALENRLDALPAPDAVDQAVRPSLERIETSYDSGSWSVLANRMDSIFRVRRLRMIKIAEAAIFLLLLINLKGFFGVIESVTNPVPVKKEVPEPIAKSRTPKQKKQITAPVLTDQNVVAQQQNFAEQLVAFVQNVSATLTQDLDNKAVITLANSPKADVSNSSVLDPALFYSQAGIVNFPIQPSIPKSQAAPVLFARSFISIPGNANSKSAKARRFYAASYGSYDKNYLREGDHSDKKTGYGGGLAVGYRKGKWGVEAGLQYSQKNYLPKRENVEYQNDPFNGISFYHIDNVDADVFSVPVKATRRIAKVRKTTAHAVAGMTANFATTKTYAYQTAHYPPPVPQPNPDPSATNTAELPNGKGVFENGGLTHNAFATADLGLRLEQPIGKRYTAFVEPIYRQSMGGGLGPNSTRLSTFSIQAGLLASL
ncbi:MAG: hypothetical protein Q7T20_03960 [Saprospiraceae bacterium]|nr:hypothetical protein [Saprospiraceae bacterium]